MTRILVTGAAGFLGQRLTNELISRGILQSANGQAQEICQIILADIVDVPVPASPDITITPMRGDLADPAFVSELASLGFDSLFHLASYLTLSAEQDPARAWAVNVEALRRLLEKAEGCPKVMFSSSIALFGGDLPDEVGDDVSPVPTTTYGIHKAINELILADYSRHGRIDGRSLRLPIVLTRPGKPQSAVSDRLAGIIREPLGGVDISAPLEPDMPVPIVSAGAVVRALIRTHDLSTVDLPLKRAFNLPALTVTVADMVKAAIRHGATGRVTYAPDPQVTAIVHGWPVRFISAHADQLGIVPDTDLDALIQDYLENK